MWIASLLSYSDLYQQTVSLPKQTILGPQRAKKIGPYQLDVSQLLGQRVRVAADRHDVALYGLGLGLQDREPVSGCGAEFRQDFLVLAEGGEFSDETLHHLLDVLSVRLLGSKGRMTLLTCLSFANLRHPAFKRFELHRLRGDSYTAKCSKA